MSKNTNLSFLTDFLTADIVNSRVGMNNVSPQSTFDVTGTGKFSGILTLGSTVSNGTYTYTLPSATGTLALTSDIPVVTGYVPYTGATQAVNLGYNQLLASTLTINGESLTGGSYLGFKHSTSVNTGNNGYTSIYTFGTNTIGFKSISGATTRDFSFSMASITPGVPGGRTYTLPDADGTIALTSSLSGYLPLTGGTLTGALIGTSASFSGFVGVNGSPATAIPLEAYINSSTAYTTSSRGNVFRVFNTTTSTNTFAGIEFAIEGNANAAVAGINGIWTGSGSAALSFYTRDASTFGEKMRITSGGNVLIGTTTDNTFSRLQVLGSAWLGQNVNRGLYFADGGSYTSIVGLNQGVSSYNSIELRASGVDGQLFLATSGNVLIGTTTDASGKLQVLGADNAIISQIKSSSGMIQIYPYLTANDGPIIQALDGGAANYKNLRIECIATTIKGPNSIVTNGAAANINLHTTNAYGADIGGTIGFGGLFNGSASTEFAVIAGKKENATINNLSGYLAFYTRAAATDPIERMRITSGGNVLIGTTTNDGAKLRVEGGEVRVTTSNSGVALYQNSGVGEIAAYNWGGGAYIPLVHVGSEHRFNTSTTERMRITSSGSVGIGKTGSINQVDIYYASGDLVNARTGQGQGNATSLFTGWSGASPTTSGSLVFNVTSNGNVTNTNNSYGSLSDIVLKENIVDTTSKLADLLKVKIRNYNLIGTDKKQIGVIAQELETIFPSMIETNSEGLKSVKYSVFVPMLIKAIQEQQQQIQELKNKLS